MNKKVMAIAALATVMFFITACSTTPGTVGVDESGGFDLEELVSGGSTGLTGDEIPSWILDGANGSSDGDWI